MKAIAQHQPEWSCSDCGRAFGAWFTGGQYTGPLSHLSTWHVGLCSVCHDTKAVTEARDFGYFAPEWQPKLPFPQ